MRFAVLLALWVAVPPSLGLVTAGRATAADPPKLGLLVVQTNRGVSVSGVTPGGVADYMGFEADDLIVRLNDRPVQRIDDVRALLDGKTGRYVIEVKKKNGVQAVISGSLGMSKSSPSKLAFVRDKKK